MTIKLVHEKNACDSPCHVYRIQMSYSNFHYITDADALLDRYAEKHTTYGI